MPTRKARHLRFRKLNKRFLANLAALTGVPAKLLAVAPKRPQVVHRRVRTLLIT